MLFKKKPASNKSVSTFKQFCLRCPSVELEALPSPENITFYRCSKCKREFAQQAGESLTERWTGPLSLVLYSIIFAKPYKLKVTAEQVAKSLREQKTPKELDWIIRGRGRIRQKKVLSHFC